MRAASVGYQALLAILLFQTISCDTFDCHVGVARRHIPTDWVCDNVDDCENGLDESNCTYAYPCDVGEMMCLDFTCISKYYKCDGEVDCPVGDDEKHCDSFDISHLKDNHETHVLIPIECREFKCKSGGQCLVNEAVCDGMKDCPDGDDEENCRPSTSRCAFGHVECARDHVCIPRYWVCDGSVDCTHGDDEEDCDEDVHHITSYDHCSSDEYQCAEIRGRPTCIPKNNTCDGKRDCPFGDDERYYCQNISDADGSLFVSLAHEATIDEVGWMEILRENVVGLKDVVWDVHESNIYYSQQYPAENPGIIVCENRLLFCRQIIHGRVDPDGMKYQIYGGLAVDPSRGYLYWIEAFGTNYEIKSAKLDGSEPKTLIGEKLLLPTELALDQERNELYYSDFGITGIEKINLDTMTRHVDITKGVHYVRNLKYFNKVLYWTDRDTITLKATNVQDKNTITRHTFNSFPQALAINHSAYQMVPKNGPWVDCPWIRVSVPSNTSHLQALCLCPDDYHSDGNSCMVTFNGTWPLTIAKKYLDRLCQDGSLCLNGGNCSQKGNATVCHCQKGYYGKICEKKEGSSQIWQPVLVVLVVLAIVGAVVAIARTKKCADRVQSSTDTPESVAVLPLIDESIYNRLSTSSLESFANPNH